MTRHFWTACLFAFSLVPSVRADTFAQVTVTGFFQNFPNLALTGGFIFDENTRQIVSVDFFHGSDQLDLLVGSFNVSSILATNSVGDHLSLLLVGSGQICGDRTVDQLPECNFQSSAFVSHVGLGYEAFDDLAMGQYTITPKTPEPGSLILLAAGSGLLFAIRKRVVGLHLIARHRSSTEHRAARDKRRF